MKKQIYNLLFVLSLLICSGTMCSYAQKTIFEETFSDCVGIKDSTEIPVGNFGLTPKNLWKDTGYKADNFGWSATGNVYEATGCIRVGNTSNIGSATTPELKYSGYGILYFDVAPWNGSNSDGKTLSVQVSISGGGKFDNGNSNKTIVVDYSTQLKTFPVRIKQCNANSRITFTIDETDRKSEIKNYFIDNVKIVSSPFNFSNKAIKYNYIDASSYKGEHLDVFDNVNTECINYVSSNLDVANVNEETGEVSVCGVGETVISARYTAAGDYYDFSDSYTLTVTKADVSLSFNPDHLSLDVAKGLIYNKPELINPLKLPIVYSCEDNSIVKVDPVEGLENFTGKEGTTTVFAEFMGNDIYNSAKAELICTVVNSANIKKFALVKSINDLNDGEEVILVGKYKGNTYVIDKYNGDTAYNTLNIEPDNDGYIIPQATTSILTINKADDKSWYLKDGDKYIGSNNTKNTPLLKIDSYNETTCKLNLNIDASNYYLLAGFSKLNTDKNKDANFIGCNWNYIKCYSKSDVKSSKSIWLYSKVPTIGTVTLNENDNDLNSVINAYLNKDINVAIQRTFYNDSWNTWCMPFDMPQDSLRRVFGERTEVCKFVSADDNTIVIAPCDDTLAAGKPYLLWPEFQIENPSFHNMKIVNIEPVPDTHGNVSFCGKYEPYPLNEDGTELFLNSKNKLAKPKSGKNKIRGMRAFFSIKNSEMLPTVVFAKEPTSIKVIETNVSESKDNIVYNLYGQRIGLSNEKLGRGIYIIKGKKILISK